MRQNVKRQALSVKRILGLALVLWIGLATAVGAAGVGDTPTPTTGVNDTPIPTASLYLPMVVRQPTAIACPTTSLHHYASGPVFQHDMDDPVRPAAAHADKNLALRGYVANGDAALHRELVNYGTDDPTMPPQLATLFDPPRVPPLVGFYRVHDWLWAPSPAPGQRGDPLTTWPVTALGLQTTPGELLHVPTSAYDIGQGFEVIVLYADERRVALRYAREDSAGAQGYTVHVDGLCTDPNLLALYAQLDAANGPRYVYRPPTQRPYSYPLPTLAAGQPIGVARSTEVVVAVVDTGRFMDPRSCNEWWQIRPGYAGTCPPHEPTRMSMPLAALRRDKNRTAEAQRAQSLFRISSAFSASRR